jgi:hypothetical protein
MTATVVAVLGGFIMGMLLVTLGIWIGHRGQRRSDPYPVLLRARRKAFSKYVRLLRDGYPALAERHREAIDMIDVEMRRLP